MYNIKPQYITIHLSWRQNDVDMILRGLVMMMLDYEGGRGGGGVKNLIKSDSIISEWS